MSFPTRPWTALHPAVGHFVLATTPWAPGRRGEGAHDIELARSNASIDSRPPTWCVYAHEPVPVGKRDIDARRARGATGRPRVPSPIECLRRARTGRLGSARCGRAERPRVLETTARRPVGAGFDPRAQNAPATDAIARTCSSKVYRALPGRGRDEEPHEPPPSSDAGGAPARWGGDRTDPTALLSASSSRSRYLCRSTSGMV